MQLSQVRIQNYRSFKDETIPLDKFICFVGPNGSGKSNILMALNVFFRNSETPTSSVMLAKEDFHHGNTEPVNEFETLTFGI